MPPVITLESPFARQVFHERHAVLFNRLKDAHPYGPKERAALDNLLETSQNGTIAEPEPAFDREQWLAWDQRHFGTPWPKAPFLWAESYFYRLLLGAVGYFETKVDPFGPFKTAELHTLNEKEDYAWLENPLDFDAALMASLYGNRADLGFQLIAGNTEIHNQLVADDSAKVHDFFRRRGPVPVTFVLDNAGRELLSDLIFADHLLTNDLATDVTLHTKPYPYYVSDATMTDVSDCMRRLKDLPGGAGQRLHAAAADGRLRIRTHPFHCAPLSFHDMPADLANELKSGLTIFKGDLNYRRLVGDCYWDPATPFRQTVSYLPGPTVALRILKSEVLVGADNLESAERTAGTHAMIQMYQP
ncbi:protein-glutamate O-methyltransferase family protein [Kibdelosporangium philippinense]|uniref:Protein-glutamate O-methyltransferase family protein n=1 Tax=Kibdelosporangium philippinense TaxID=211113 RepID=A0ABS8Z6E9_9PSEU|nr:damage-control phosphatase ARMT1 family protein [Kibdelosporangium philippinense]MCE7002619.1 protein-glutamate O-methyltransferase family protein [Kibdelosporangium philippinense]